MVDVWPSPAMKSRSGTAHEAHPSTAVCREWPLETLLGGKSEAEGFFGHGYGRGDGIENGLVIRDYLLTRGYLRKHR